MAAGKSIYPNTGPIINFERELSKNWKYCPPSTNLWTVKIKNASNGEGTDTSLSKLYANIINANNSYSKLVSNLWTVKDKKEGATFKSFITKIGGGNYGIILCQSVTLPDLSVTAEQSYGELDNYRGFLMPGHTVNNRAVGKQVQLSFLGTNYDLKDMLFTPWCAAIAQQGLIEDDDLPCLRADLYINLYSPNEANETANKLDDLYYKLNDDGSMILYDTGWFLRKQIKVTRAYPISISDVNGAYDYETENAGKFRVFNVDFNFDEISIEYHR